MESADGLEFTPPPDSGYQTLDLGFEGPSDGGWHAITKMGHGIEMIPSDSVWATGFRRGFFLFLFLV